MAIVRLCSKCNVNQHKKTVCYGTILFIRKFQFQKRGVLLDMLIGLFPRNRSRVLCLFRAARWQKYLKKIRKEPCWIFHCHLIRGRSYVNRNVLKSRNISVPSEMSSQSTYWFLWFRIILICNTYYFICNPCVAYKINIYTIECVFYYVLLRYSMYKLKHVICSSS